ncbi:MAG: FecR domain-containing protein [Cyclobacteriaceae bacterium]
MKYKDYKVTDFIKDDFFVEWVKNPDSETKNFWTEWITANPEQIRTINRARKFVISLEYEDHEPLRREEYAEMFENILRQEKPKTSPLIQRNYTRILLNAAVVSLIILTSIYYLYFIIGHSKDIEPEMEVTVNVKNNPKGRKSLTKLPDGTLVKLNAESTLTYHSQFGIDTRNVELRGEAFFDVTPDDHLPFVIKAGGIETHVIGTSFNVRAFEDEGNTQVIVVSGEVTVSDNFGNSIILNPHEMLEYNRYGNTLKKSVCSDLKRFVAWKDGILIFDNDPFDIVVDKLEQWYDVDIKLAENFHVPGDYTGEYSNKSLEIVLDGISYASGFKYLIDDNKIFITQ